MKSQLRTYILAVGAFVVLAICLFTTPSANAQVLVRDVDNPAFQPYVFNASQNWISDAPNVSFLPSVPAGKRLVIEQVSFDANVKPSQSQKISVEVLATVHNANFSYFFIGASRGPAGIYDDWVGAAQMRLYADPGAQEILVHRTDTSGGDADYVSVSLSGYLATCHPSCQ